MFLPSQIYDGVLVLESTENEDKEKKVKSLSRVRLFATLWTVARQAPLSVARDQIQAPCIGSLES